MPEKTGKGKRSKRVKFDKDEEGLKRVKDSRRQHDDYGDFETLPMITPSKVLSCFLRSMFRRQRLKQKDKTLLKPAIAMTMVEGGKMKQITRLSKNMKQRNPMPCLAGTAPALTPVIR